MKIGTLGAGEVAQAFAIHLLKAGHQVLLSKLPDWEGRILMDATNHFLLPSMELADLKGRVSSEIVSELAPSAKVVKALNTLYASNLARDPKIGKGRRVIFISGDDGGAKGEVSVLLKGLGFAFIDLGSLREGGRAQQVGNGLAGVDLVQFED